MKRAIITSLFILAGFQINAQEFITSEQPEPTANALFGWASAINEYYAVVTAPQKDIGDLQSVGSAFLYRRGGEGWVIREEFSPSELRQLSNFGISADINYDYIAVGSLGDPDRGLFAGAVYLYSYTDTSITETQKLVPSDAGVGSQFSYSLDFAPDYNILAVGAYQADGASEKTGAVYLFEENEEGEFVQIQKLVAEDGQSHDYFGHNLTFLSWDILAVSAYNADGAEERSGAVYIFERTAENEWVQTAKLFDPNGSSSDLFGYSVERTNDVYVPVKTVNASYYGNLFVGAPGTNHNNGQTGSVYVFAEDSETGWSHVYTIVEEEAEENDHFGVSLAHNAYNGLFVGASKSGVNNSGKIFRYNISWSYNPDNPVEQVPFLGNISDFEPEYYGSKLTASSDYYPQFIFSSPYQTVDNKSNAGSVEFYYTLITSNEQEPLGEITQYKLEQNYPNPFNPSTTINYQVKDPGMVTLTVFNLLGQEVQVLVSEQQTVGAYTATFDASAFASGFYFYRLEVNNFVSTKKMMLIK